MDKNPIVISIETKIVNISTIHRPHQGQPINR